MQRFLESVDTHLRWIVGDARLLVVARHPARAEPELDPSAREDVDGGDLFRHDNRVLVVVVEARALRPAGRWWPRRRPSSPASGRAGRRSGRGGRGCCTQVLDPAGLGRPLGRGRCRGDLDAEPEASIVSHVRSRLTARESVGRVLPAGRRSPGRVRAPCGSCFVSLWSSPSPRSCWLAGVVAVAPQVGDVVTANNSTREALELRASRRALDHL